jgi:hypothetical protein
MHLDLFRKLEDYVRTHGVREAARNIEIDAGYLVHVLKGERNIGNRIANFFNYRALTVFTHVESKDNYDAKPVRRDTRTLN